MTIGKERAFIPEAIAIKGEHMDDTQVQLIIEQKPFYDIQSAPIEIGKPKKGKSLFSKNVKIGSKRTSVRLEPQMWQALNEIAAMEKCTIHQLCTAVNDLKKVSLPFTAALRVFLMEYYRSAARISPEVSEIRKLLQSG